MSEPKVRLNLVIPGNQMYTDDEIKGMTKDKAFNYSKLEVSFRNNKNKKPSTQILNIYTKKCKPAKQSIQLMEEAYHYMISNNTPEFSNIKKWKALSKKQRLEEHLARIASNFNAISFTYEVLED